MTAMHILFVDDHADQRDLFNDAVQDWNLANPERLFHPTILGTADEAKEALAFNRFDCALFDLKFKMEDGVRERLSGNDLARAGIEDNGIPVGIISGETGDLDDALARRGLLNAFTKRPDAFRAAMEWFGSLWQMMEVMAGARQRIRRAEADIFLRRLWAQWAQYATLPHVDQLQLETIVTRQFVSHIAETLGADGGDNPEWHPFECYIRPALQDNRAQTGDIFQRGAEYWVVLSPPCDMANLAAEGVLLAYCSDVLPEKWAEKLERLGQQVLAGQISNSIGEYFGNLSKQNIEGSKHFLPPLDGRLVMVDFKKLQTVPLAELSESLGQRVASVSAPFLMNLTQRFGAYFGRPGQPNIDIRYFVGG